MNERAVLAGYLCYKPSGRKVTVPHISRRTGTGGELVVIGHDQPAVGFAETQDGSFALVEGDVYRGTERLPSAVAAAHVLDEVHRHGIAALSVINADALCVTWDARTETLSVARDRLGTVPAYWCDVQDGVIWGTDLPALTRLGASTDTDLVALDMFLTIGRVPAPWTVYEQIRKIPPAHLLTFGRRDALRISRWWSATGQPKADGSDPDVMKDLLSTFQRALARRMDVPGATGALLSSGIDSTLVVAGVRNLLQVPITTFTFHYGEYEGPFNEDDVAAERARYFGSEHHPLQMRPLDIEERFQTVVAKFGEPFTQGIHTFLLDKVHDFGVTTLLTGVGPDGWFFDSRRLRQLALLRAVPEALASPALRFTEIAARWFPFMHEWQRAIGASVHEIQFDQVLATNRARSFLFLDRDVSSIARRELRELVSATRAFYSAEDQIDREVFTTLQSLNADQSLFWLYRWGKINDLTIRHPYCDMEFFAAMMRLRRDSTEKDDLRRLAELLMPRDIAWTKKIYQSVPIIPWLQGPLAALVRETLSPERIERSGLFSPLAVHSLVEEHLSGAPSRVTGRVGGPLSGLPMTPRRRAFTIWSLMTLTEWHLNSRRAVRLTQ